MMYKSLYADINPLAAAGATGMLDIVYEKPPNGCIRLRKGEIAAVRLGDHEGLVALKVMSKLLRFSSFFSEEPPSGEPPEFKCDTGRILEQLRKVENYIPAIKKKIGGNEAVFQFDRRALRQEQSFSPAELEISFALDGAGTVGQVVEKTNIPELDVLMGILHFLRNGAAAMIRAHGPMGLKRRKECLNALEETLAEVTGPVAPVIVSRSLEFVEEDAGGLCSSDLPLLLATVAHHLEEEEKKELHGLLRRDRSWSGIISF